MSHGRVVTLEEKILRQRVTADIMTLGTYETPIWAETGWLFPMGDVSPEYDTDNIPPAIIVGLLNEGIVYAAPFYGETPMAMFRTDLIEQAGAEMPVDLTQTIIPEAAAAMADRAAGINGIFHRSKAGWGEGGAGYNFCKRHSEMSPIAQSRNVTKGANGSKA